jgi:hypothetical protein
MHAQLVRPQASEASGAAKRMERAAVSPWAAAPAADMSTCQRSQHIALLFLLTTCSPGALLVRQAYGGAAGGLLRVRLLAAGMAAVVVSHVDVVWCRSAGLKRYFYGKGLERLP